MNLCTSQFALRSVITMNKGGPSLEPCRVSSWMQPGNLLLHVYTIERDMK